MCGRYTLANPARLLGKFPWMGAAPRGSAPRYNIAPGQRIFMIPHGQPYGLVVGRWGLSPKFMGHRHTSALLINARRETVLEKPTFARWFRGRRCLIPADGFYEWPPVRAASGDRGGHGPFYFVRSDGDPFTFAGFSVPGVNEKGETEEQGVILTAAAEGVVAAVHPRMPVILSPQMMQGYLESDPEKAVSDSLGIDMHKEIRMYRVGPAVNRVSCDGPEAVMPAESGTTGEEKTSLLF